MPLFSSKLGADDRPPGDLSLWTLYPLFFVAVYLSHLTLLRLPYYWDEGGYYIPAALDFYRHHLLIPQTTSSNAHPPLPSILLAAAWHVTGLVISGTRTFLCMVAAAALLGVYRLAKILAGTPAAIATTLLTALYPVWFAQSTLAHADLFAAAFTLWALSFYLETKTTEAAPCERSLAACAVLFTLAALSKETAIITPIALAAWEAWLLLREREQRRAHAVQIAALFSPVIPLAAWYAYHRHKTGYLFGNPAYLRYNATANLDAYRIALSLWHRLLHLTTHMNMFVATVCLAAVLFMPRIRAGRIARPALAAIAVVLAANWIAFSILGGALLTRYLLPLYPLVLVICVSEWRARLRRWWPLAALSAAGFLAGIFINPPYAFAPEDNLTYRDMIVLHQQAAAIIATHYPQATVLTTWPATDELSHPDLGYLRHPVKTVALENFSFDEIERAAADPGAYDTALLFSTKYIPPGIHLSHLNQAADARYFDFHYDLQPREAAALLHGDIVWQGYRNGEWAAILRFPRSEDARLHVNGNASDESPAVFYPR